jgi:hypothetical protein
MTDEQFDQVLDAMKTKEGIQRLVGACLLPFKKRFPPPRKMVVIGKP